MLRSSIEKEEECKKNIQNEREGEKCEKTEKRRKLEGN